MIIPIRCWSCGKPIAHLWDKYQEELKTNNPKEVLDKLGVERYCCRSMFLGQVELADIATKFKKF